MLGTRSQLARRSLGVLRQQLEQNAELIEHVLTRHHWVLEFLETRNSKLDTGDISPLFGLKPPIFRLWLQCLQDPWTQWASTP